MSIRIKNILVLTSIMIVGCQPKNKDTDTLVTIHTTFGDIKVVLFDDTPKHKESFITMAKEGLYDSTTFHRVMNNFMIQGGDVGAKPGLEKEGKRLIGPSFNEAIKNMSPEEIERLKELEEKMRSKEKMENHYK